MAELGQWTVAAFKVGRGQIIKHQGVVGKVAYGEFPLDALLARKKPVHGAVEFGFVGGIQIEQLAQAAVEGVGVKSSRSSQLGGRI